MSRIFDALQRSEAERSGTSGPEVSSATDLLRHAENRAVLEWEDSGADVPQSRPTGKSTGRNGHTAPASNGATASGNGARAQAAVAEDTHSQERPAVFEEFPLLRVSAPVQGRLVSVSDKESAAAEAFRLLAVRLRHMRRDRALKRILITSSIPQEGKSTCSANLACSLALRAQQRTLLLEGDIRRPSLAPMFGLAPRPGICEWLREDRELKDSIYYLEGPGLWFMPAGSSSSNPLELLQSGKLSRLMDQVSELFDWVVVDSPPVLPLADTSVWSRLCDGILLVTRQGVTEKRQLQRGVEAIEPQKLIGAILNSSNSAPHSYYYYSARANNGSS
jgi:capsular exopolysaccharide synthesis family protein